MPTCSDSVTSHEHTCTHARARTHAHLRATTHTHMSESRTATSIGSIQYESVRKYANLLLHQGANPKSGHMTTVEVVEVVLSWVPELSFLKGQPFQFFVTSLSPVAQCVKGHVL